MKPSFIVSASDNHVDDRELLNLSRWDLVSH